MLTTNTTYRESAVAIVGLAGRFPGAPDVDVFWRNLRAGVESVSTLTDAQIVASGCDPGVLSDPSYVRARALLDDVDQFDAPLFGFTPRDAETADPQQRVMLELAWAALESAGCDPSRFDGAIGVYAGSSLNTYLLANLLPDRASVQDLVSAYQVGGYGTIIGNDKDYLATRISYKLDLRGPSVVVQSACSTSLVAVSQAVHSLISGQCDMALAGGVSITFPQERGYVYQEGAIVSPDGHCRPFDANAAGTVFGSGAGLVVLRRLDDAIANGDPIRAVILGTGLSNDGALKVSYMAPSVDGQAEAIRRAHRMAGIDPETISYVEGHGTATPLGDPIEIAALTKAFRDGGSSHNGFCLLGSSKSNIGHLAEASGVAGLLKTVLALEHGEIPPSLHYDAPNPRIDFDQSPFRVVNRLTPWQPPSGTPRRAGVSSFGVGGTNAHVVVEQAPDRPQPAAPTRSQQLFVLSARTETALAAMAERLASHIQGRPVIDLADVAYTLQVGRRELDYRRTVVASNAADAIERLRSPGELSPKKAGKAKNVAFLFPGQGSQHVNMARELYDTEPAFRQDVDACAERLTQHLGLDLRDLLFPCPEKAEEAARLLTETRVTQPALFAIEYAVAMLWVEWGIVPDALMGHSIGEYVAATLAGVFSLDDALRIVAARGRLMQSMPPGTMLAVRLPEDEVRALIGPELSIAALNSPMLTVVSGAQEAIDELDKRLEELGKPARRLHTSHAFHSAMMEPMLPEFRREFDGVNLERPRIPFVSDVTGDWITDEQAVDPEYWVQHVRLPVRFATGVATLLRDEGRVLLETGPSNVLTALAKQAAPGRASMIFSSLDHPTAEGSQSAYFAGALGRLWQAGITPDWLAFHGGQPRQRVVLPSYPFEHRRYWVSPPSSPERPSSPGKPAGGDYARIETYDAGVPVNDLARNGSDTGPEPSLARDHENAVIMNYNEPASRADHLVSRILEVVHDLSGLSVDAIDPTASFLEMGFDSLFLTQASQAFGRVFGVKVTFRDLLDSAGSPAALAQVLDAKLPSGQFMPPAPAPAAPIADDGPAADASLAAAPQFSQLQGAPTFHTAPQPPPRSSAVETIIAQQLSIMQQQLAVLAAHGFPTPTNFPSSSPIPALASLTDAPAPPAVQAPPPAPPTPAPEPPKDAQMPRAPFKQHGPFKPIDRGETGGLTTRQLAHLEGLIARYEARTRKSKEYTAANRDGFADPRAVAGFKQIWKEIVYPIVGTHSAGSRIWDLDGNEYLDVTLGFGVNLFGHKPDFVMRAVEEQMKLGVEIGPQSPLAGEVVDLIRKLTGMDRVTFCNTGSESVMASVRVARTVTGRDKVVFFNGDYHGTHDEVLLRSANTPDRLRSLPIAPGIPVSAAEQTIILDYGAPESLEIIRQHAKELAAVLVEPVQSRNPDLQPRDFLHELRKITEENGVALIFDEVITGFRSHPGGAQAVFGVRADLATYGKVIGGGMPFGVVAGSREYMDAFDGGSWSYGDASFPEVGVTFFAGTFVRHPLAMAAARAVLRRLVERSPSLQNDLNARTGAFVADLNSHFKSVGAPIHIPHFSSQFYLHFESDVKWGSLLWHHMREKGIHIWEGRPCFLSTAHTDEDVAYLAWAFKASVAEMQEGGFLPGHTPSVPERPRLQPVVAIPEQVPVVTPSDAQAPRPSMFASRPAAPLFASPEPVAAEAEPVAVASPEPVAAESEPVAVAAPEPVVAEAEPAFVAAPEPVFAEAEPAVVSAPEPVAQVSLRAPLTENQREIWLAVKMADNATRAFDESIALHLRGPLEMTALLSAFDQLCARHEAFRTTFSADGAEQIVAPEGRIEPKFDDLSNLDLAEADRALNALLAEEGSQAFDLDNGPLFSIRIVKMDALYHVVSITGHHIVFDGWSLGVALDELAALYSAAVEGRDAGLPDAERYTDYARAQEAAAGLPETRETRQYWLEQIDGEMSVPQLPTDRPRRAARSFAGSCETLSIPGGLLTGLRQVGFSKGCTLLATTCAAWSVLLARLTGQQTVTIGLPSAGQQTSENQRLLGHCVNLLPVKFCPDAGAPFIDTLVATRNALLDAYDHQNCTFGSLIDGLHLMRRGGAPPLVSVTFNVERRPAGLKFAGLEHEFTTNPRQFYQFDLGINIVETDAELLIEANYDSDLFDASTVRRWLGHYRGVLEAFVDNPALLVGDVDILTAEQRTQMTVAWSGRSAKYPRDASICGLFEEVVKLTPDKSAATLSDRKITYRQVNGYSNQLARYLLEQGAGPGKFVGILVDRSFEMLIGLLAILKTGAAYLPVDPGQPRLRTLTILETAGVDLVVTQEKHAGAFAGTTLRTIRMDTEWHLASGNSSTDLDIVVPADSPAYALFTSGSTGAPKGVVVPHRAVVRLVRGTDYATLGPEQIILQLAPLAFDASTFEIWGALLNGGRLVVAPPGELSIQRIGEEIASHAVNTMWLTAGLFHAFIDSSPELLRSLTQLLAGGDVLSVPHVAKALRELPNTRLINGYGPTENTTFTCCHTITAADLERSSIPIGYPIANTRVYILDERLRPVPQGVDGELLIGGDGLALGYLGDDELTSRKFVADPFGPGRLYRSGDRARWLPNGLIEFRGRIDTQVKIRGFRVEPGEIEQAIVAYPGVREALVVARSLEGGEKHLVAYVVPEPSGDPVDTLVLRNDLAEKLPSYMAPSAILIIDAIPLTPSGKPDRRRLPAPATEVSRTVVDADLLPRNRVEASLSAMFKNLFGRPVGVHEDFWDLGGHSLLALRLIVSIEKEFGKRFPLQTLFNAPTIEKLSEVVRGPISKETWATLVPIQSLGTRPPLYCVHHAHGVIAGYRDLARHLAQDQPVIGIQARGLDGSTPPQTKVEEIAEGYVNDILEVNPRGPYLLCGLSFGGILAFEMAKQLKQIGRQVPFVGLIDTYSPEYFRTSAEHEQQAPLVFKALAQINAIRHLEPQYRAAYVSNRIKHGLKRLRGAQGNQDLADDLDGFLPATLQMIQRASEAAMMAYYPEPYHGELVLFRAQERLDWKFTDPEMAWGGLADRIIVRESPGNHYTINQEPCAVVLANEVRRAIDEALAKL
ncbi:MAG: amino acid adenylation domain-containing protein [Capsulimonadaceae bacterium]|nr:amino acid adenylation domain-containing protein [Capsulimonadaceae bacterium]